MIFLPVLGALAQALSLTRLRNLSSRGLALIAFAASAVSGVLGLAMVFSMQTQLADLQWRETLPWIGSYAIYYDVGIDGMSALPVLLVSLLFPILISAEWARRGGREAVHAFLLLLQAAFLGALCAQDLFLLAFFWGLALLPAYFLVAIWGGQGRDKAATQLLVGGGIGNALFFCGILLIYFAIEPHSFSIKELSGGKLAARAIFLGGFEAPVSSIAFALVALATITRVPIWPLNGWFSDLAEEAPAPVFVALGGVGIPVGLYVFTRIAFCLFPETTAWAAPGIVGLGVSNLVAAGVLAFAQRDLRHLLACLCLGELGLLLIGFGSMHPAGLVGASFSGLSMGLGVSGFGLFCGWIHQKAGSTAYAREEGGSLMGGLGAAAPAAAVAMGLVTASLLGVPGLGGFVGHSLVMMGGYSVHPAVLGAALLGAVSATYYLVEMYRCVFLGKASGTAEGFGDFGFREKAYFLPLVIAAILAGVFPKPLLEIARPTLLTLLSVSQ